MKLGAPCTVGGGSAGVFVYGAEVAGLCGNSSDSRRRELRQLTEKTTPEGRKTSRVVLTPLMWHIYTDPGIAGLVVKHDSCKLHGIHVEC